MGRPDCLQETKAASVPDIACSGFHSKWVGRMDLWQQKLCVERFGSMAEGAHEIDHNYEESCHYELRNS